MSTVQDMPKQNPHPPVTAADQRRVAFVEAALQLLNRPFEKGERPGQDGSFSQSSSDFSLEITEECLNSESCLAQSAPLKTYLAWYRTGHNGIKMHKYAHIIPWSWEKYQQARAGAGSSGKKTLTTDGAPVQGAARERAMHAGGSSAGPMMRVPPPSQCSDEFMVHVYVLDRGGVWYHLDVFLAEDAKGRHVLRRFYMTPVEFSGGGDLPPGVKC